MSNKIKELKELTEKTQKKIHKKSAERNLIINVLIILVVVVLVASGLRLVHDVVVYDKSIKDIIKIPVASAAESPNKALHQSQSHTKVNIKPETGFTFTLEFENTGTSTWTKKNVYLKSLTTALKFRHSFWPDPYLPAQLTEDSVAPGETGTFVFALQSPTNYGYYTGEFLLVNDNVLIKGGRAEVIMNTVEDPENIPVEPDPEAPIVQNPSTNRCSLNLRIAGVVNGGESIDNVSCVEKFDLPNEGPEVRIGLFYLEGPFHESSSVTIKNTLAWQVYDEDDTLLASVPKGEIIRFSHSETTKEYTFDFIDKTIRTKKYLKLVNANDGYFTITSYHNVPSYNKLIDYNDFIGDMEIRHNDCSIKDWGVCRDKVWVIEKLPMETYLTGIQETTNYDPIEYLKTMSVAARTYAMYHYDRYSKHSWEFYHVDSKYDQVYKGYVSMQIFPRVGEGVRETTGILATYEDKIIVAPYFSHSDGRTRSFAEVWKTEIPYLVSKLAPYSEGKSMFGHGVGIDATDALNRARHDDWAYDQLLKYYYTGIQLEKIY